MLKIKIENSFKKDIERDKTSGKYTHEDFELLKSLIQQLEHHQPIETKHNRHPLKGSLKSLECLHVKGDWLLIFTLNEEFVTLVMLGKHTQVYKKF